MTSIVQAIKRLFRRNPDGLILKLYKKYGPLQCPECGKAEMKDSELGGFSMCFFDLNKDSCLACGTVVSRDWKVA
jgi:hypothetical protein